ncbi:hypothetical protein ACHHV8_24700 [Paenibacillus sp. TAB 01]|uniref:hypothetical protein n=1 Tax=Paenibacillus sp. TAB 01 TaxID=3368988 RepID=UPI003753B47C
MIMPNFTRWMGSHRDVRLLQTVTLLRSVGQGIALVDMSLLLRELGWSGGAIGALLAAAGIVKTAATLLAGELNALLGAKRFLLLLELITAFAALAVSLTTHTVALDIAIVSAGLGSGHSGSGGPASPIERAWLAAYARYDSSRLFHANALLGYLGMGIGCLLGCLPSWYGSLLAGPDAYRPAFALIALSAAGGAALLLRISGGKRKPKPKPAEAPEAAAAVQRAAVTEQGAAIERSAAAGRGAAEVRGAATMAERGAAAEQSAVAERTAAAKPSAEAERNAAVSGGRSGRAGEGMKLLLLALSLAAGPRHSLRAQAAGPAGSGSLRSYRRLSRDPCRHGMEKAPDRPKHGDKGAAPGRAAAFCLYARHGDRSSLLHDDLLLVLGPVRRFARSDRRRNGAVVHRRRMAVVQNRRRGRQGWSAAFRHLYAAALHRFAAGYAVDHVFRACRRPGDRLHRVQSRHPRQSNRAPDGGQEPGPGQTFLVLQNKLFAY